MKKCMSIMLAAALLLTLCPASAESGDLALLTIEIGFYDYVLGQSTPQDFINDGWIVTPEDEGTFSVVSDWGAEGIYIGTENGQPDEPILFINTFWSDGVLIEYNGFDGIVGIMLDDADQVWYPGGMTEEQLSEFVGDEGTCSGLWDGFCNWILTSCGGEVSDEGIYSAKVTLGNGQIIEISSHDSPPAIALTGQEAVVDNTPFFMTPSIFVDYFNALMTALADNYADTLGEDGVSMIKENFTIVQKDEAMPIAYYGSKDWRIEAAFYYPDAENPTDTMPAYVMNLAIKTGTPDVAAYFARRAFSMMIAYEYQDDAITQGLAEWIENVTDPADMFSIPGYTVNVFMTEEYTQYAVIPVDEKKEKADENALLTVTFDGNDYILGKSTPAEIAGNKWDLNREEDGTFILSNEYYEGMLFLRTEHGDPDEPITMFNAMWADEYLFEYCGFDGIINPGLAQGEDPDERWNTDYPYEVLINAWENPDIVIPPWGAMQNWLTETYGATLSEEGIYEARISLSDGRTLVITTHDSPACLELVSE